MELFLTKDVIYSALTFLNALSCVVPDNSFKLVSDFILQLIFFLHSSSHILFSLVIVYLMAIYQVIVPKVLINKINYQGLIYFIPQPAELLYWHFFWLKMSTNILG